MASFPDLRPLVRLAKAEGRAVPFGGLVLILSAAAIAVSTLAFVAVSELATLRGHKAHVQTSAFLARTLGARVPSSRSETPASDIRLTRPALGAKLQIAHGGLQLSSGNSTLSLQFANAGRTHPWRTYARGIGRTTSFGQETIAFGTQRVEESLLVDRHVGTRLWRWRLNATTLHVSLAPDGTVRFRTRSGGDSGLRILPVAILDEHGENVTPRNSRWSLVRRSSGWWLELRLDDAKLPSPYVIDPIALVGTCNTSVAGTFAGCSVNAVSNKTSIQFTRPTSVTTGSLMLAQITVRNNAALTVPGGWTQIGNLRTNGAGLEQALYYRVATAADTAATTYTWSWTGGADATGVILGYSGTDTSNPFDGTPTDNAGNGTSASATSLTTVQAGDMLVALYGAQGVSGSAVSITQNGGEGLTQEATVNSGSGPASRATSTAADGIQASAGATGAKTAAVSPSANWIAHLAAIEAPLSADGSGTLTTTTSAVSASQTGNTITFTYTAASGGMSNGAVTIAVPSGWSAPSTVAANAGYTTSSTGTVSVAGQTITVSGVTLGSGSTLTITYGSKAGGGPGATATATTGAQTWQGQEKSSSGGTLTNLSSSPSITVYAADGSGTLTTTTSAVSASQTGNTITFTYTAATGGMSNGSVTVAVPSGWTAPSTTSSGAGYTTSSTGTVSVAGQTITVSGITLAGGSTLTITYGDKTGGGSGATATATTGAQTWQGQERSTSGGSLNNLSSSPSITVYAADGSGTLTTGTSSVSASSTGNTITFTYTAATGGLSNGSVTVAVPTGWSAPSLTNTAAGYTTASTGTVSVSGQTITVSSVTLAGGSTFTITYGNKNGGTAPGATAGTTTGSVSWTAQEKSTSGGSLANLASSPSITVYSADGSGTLTTTTSNVSAGQTGNTITFTYTAATGGMSGGAVTVAVPAGWTAPSTVSNNAGYTTASTGSVTVSGQTITVSSVTLAGGSTLTIVYGDKSSGGVGATATSTTGSQTWQGQEKSLSGGSLTNLASSPSITVNAADGTGTMSAAPTLVSASQSGRTITFTYTAAAGGISSGSVTLAVPSGWSAPSITSSAAGYTTSSTGTVSVSGSTITVSSVTLAGGSTLTITYGDTSGGGPGATSTSTTGAQTWQTQEKSTAGGSLANIASSPSITVYAADGSGTLGASVSALSASQSGRTITFTYTAAAGGISNGSVTLAVPSGWSAPSTTSSAAGYTTSSAGTVSVSGQTITVSSVTLAGGSTLTITYGNTSGGGPGATATSTTGAQTWQTQEKSTAAGSLTNLASSPSITVYAADGSGTLGASISAVSASQSGRTITFTYTAAAGGASNGSVTLAVPSGWTAPSTLSSNGGYTTASTGSVSVSGQTITVSSVTLAGGSTLTITYGDTSGGGPGATATSTTGAQAWQTQEKSTAAGSLTSIASSPSITVYAGDGSGTLTTGTSSVSASSTGNTVTFTYTAASGGMSNGSVTLAVPGGWSAPSTTSNAAGYTTSSTGTVSVSGQTITVSSVTLAGGSTLTLTYGNTGSGGPGATATATTGAQTWQVQEKSTAAGSLTNIASSPGITVYAADGSGTLTTPTTNVSASQTGRTVTFTYTAAAGGMSNGAVTVAVPSGWSAPSTTATANGYTTSSAGTVSVSGQTITVSGVTLSGGSTLTITYGDKTSGGPGATATSTTGAQTWQAQEKSLAGDSLANLASSPSITVNAADGSGTLTSGTPNVVPGSSGNTITFTYTAASGGLSNGSVTLVVPSGWTAPSTVGTTGGYTTASTGTVSASGQTITVSGVTLSGGSTFTIIYGDKGSGGPGATATSTSGAQTWQAQERSTSAGSLTNLSSSPNITVLSSDGSGTLTTPTGSVNSASIGNTLTFTYTAATGGTSNGTVTLAVPSGWSAPSTTATAAGYTSAGTGTVTVSGQTITVAGVTLNGGSTFTITYGDTAGGGPGATAAVPAGAQTWQAQERSTAGGTLTNLATSPSITINDTTPPSAPALSFGSFTNASATGATVYIRQGAAGGFTVTGTSSDPESGVDHLTFASGLGAGWSGGGADATAPYQGVYTFSAAATAPAGNQNVTATNGWALTSSATPFTVVSDTTPPSVTAPSVTAGYYTTTSVPVTPNGGTDAGSGVATGSSQIQRDSATLSNGTCGSFSGSWSNVSLVAGNDVTVSSGHCYEYREQLTDNVGNVGSSSASNVAKVDTSAPSTPTLAFSGLSANAYFDGASTVYFRPSAGGTFTVTASSSDAESGIASYTFGTLNSNGGSNWSGTQSGNQTSYTFDATTTAPTTARTVSATSPAGLTSSNATYSIAADTAAPSVTAPTVTAGYYAAASVPVTTNGGTDSGSGVASGSSQVQRDVANLAGGSCGSFSGSWTNVTLTGGADTSVTNAHCYEYREQLADNVGNVGASSASSIAKVDTSGPTNALSLSPVSGGAIKSGTTVYYRGAAAGSFKLTNAVADAESGPASSATAALGGTSTGWSHTPSTVSTPAGGPYDSNTFAWSAGTSSSPTEVVTGADVAGNTTPASALTFTNDTNAPTGGALTVNGTAASAGGTTSTSSSGSFPIDARTDYSEAQTATESGLATSTLTRQSATLSGGSCGSYGSPTTIAGNPSQSLPTGCYLYTLTGTDNVGNSTSISTTVLVDTTAPSAPSLTISNLTGNVSASGTTVSFLQTGSGSFDVTASSSDGESGISGYTFPSAASMGSGWSVSGSGATRTYSFTPGAAQPGTKNVVAMNGVGTTAGSSFTVLYSDSTPPTTTIQCNGSSCQAGYYTSTPVTVTLTADDGVGGSGVQVIRYTTDGTSPTLVNGSDYVAPISLFSTTTVKFRAYDNAGNAEAVGSQTILIDGTPPTGPTLTLSENPASGAQHVSGTTLFYRPGAGGTFRVSAATSDPQTGIASVAFPSVANVTGGGTLTSSPYDMDYTWGASTTDSASHNVVATNGAGSTSSAPFTLTPDSAAPTGQAITLTGAGAPYYPTASVTFSLTDGSDGSGSGVDTASRTVTRESAPLVGDSCGTFTADAGTYSSPDTGVSDGHCYRYTFTVADNVGNVSAPVTATAKVDTSAPIVALTAPTELSGAAAQYFDAAAKTQYFRPSGSGSFSLNATASDSVSAVTGVAFPDVSSTTGWSGSTGGTDTTSPYSSPTNYTWTSGATAPGAQNVTATDKAGNTGTDTITIAADSTAPSGQSITLTGSSAPYYTTPSVTFALGDGSDAASGIDTSSRSVTRESATLSGDTCGSFSADAGTFTSPDTAVVSGHCYRYTFTIADNVGNVSAPVAAIAKVDTTAPAVSVTAPTELTGAANQYYDSASQTQYFRPSGSGSFALNASASDADTGVSGVTFPDVSSVSGWAGSTGGTDTSAPYSSPADYTWTAGANAPGAKQITAMNGAGQTGTGGVTIAADSAAPTGQTVTLTGATAPYYKTTSVTFTLGDGSDAGSGIDTSTRTVTRESATLNGDTCGTFTADVGTFTSPDASVSGGHCYRYSFTISDNVGNVSAAATATAKVDTVAPVVATTSPTELTGAGNQYYDSASKTQFFRSTGSGSFTLNANASDTHTDVAGVAFPDVSGIPGWTGSTGGTDTSAPFSSPVTYVWSAGAGLPGAQTLTATDKAGNTATDTITLKDDTSAPTGQTITLTGGSAPYFTSGSVTFSLADGTDNGGGSGVDTASRTVTRETAPLAGNSCGTFVTDAGTFTSPDTGVANGHCYRYSFVEADNVGNQSSPVQVTAKVDSGSPSATLTDPGSPLRGTVTLNATASDGETGVQQVAFQRAPAGTTTWTTIGTDTTAPYSVNWDTTAVADGAYDLRVVATDVAGNTGASATVANRTVDNTAPDTTIVSHPPNPSNNPTPTFQFSSTEPGSTFECRVDGGAWASCTSPDTLPALAAGTHTFDVRATDLAGNTDATPASYTWDMTFNPPDTSIDSAPANPSNNPTPTFQFSSTKPNSTFECRVDGGAWSSCTSPDTLGLLAAGSHTFDVRATDQAGNTDPTPASYTWTIDLTSPTVTITAPTLYINSSDPNNYPVSASTPDTDVTKVDFYECSDGSAACSTGTWNLFATDTTAPYGALWTTPAFDGTKAIRAVATDAAGNTGQHIRTITIDRTPPSGVTVSYPAGYANGSVPITTGNGPDPDVDPTTGVIERQTATLSNDTCGGYGAFTGVTSPDTVPSGNCAMYRYHVADNAGNVATATSTSVVKRDTAAPTSSVADPGANLRGTITLSASAADTGGSGVASVAFERQPSGGGAWTTIGTDSTSPYSVSFDTTTVSDGLYDFRAVATDVAGNTETAPVNVVNRRIDNTPPSATMLSPGNPVRATVSLTSSTSDSGSGIASVAYEIAPNGGSFSSQAASWDTTTVVDGLYDLRVVATDAAGNSTTSAAITTRVDNTPPAVTFSSPATGANVGGTVALVASATDASPASPPVTFEYKLHSSPPASYTPTSASWNTATLPGGDGLYDLRATATDAAGNTTQVQNTSILVDNVPPAVSITSPGTSINASVASPTSFAASATDSGSGVKQVEFLACSNQSVDCSTGTFNSLGIDTTFPYGVSWNIPPDGNAALEVIATDNAGHTANAIRNVTIDTTPPFTTITSHPADPSSAPATFTFTSNEAGSSFECSLDGGAWSPCTSPKTFTGLTDNQHTVSVRSIDPAGNVDPTPPSWTWHRDSTNPTGALNTPGANIRQTVTLTSSETDPLSNGYASGVNSVAYQYSANGTTWATIGTNTSTPFDTMPWNTTGVSDGVYLLRIVVTDVAGNAFTSSVVPNVRIDNTPPTTSQDDPGAYLRATKTITGSAADSGSGVDHVDFQRSPAGANTWTTIGTDTTAPYSTSFDTTAVSDGHYDLRTVAYDVAGNQAISLPVTNRLVDNTPPTAVMDDPSTAGGFVRGTITLTSSGTSDPGGANASGVASVAYEYSTDGGATWTGTGASLNTRTLPDGSLKLHVIATDNAGNTATSAAVSDTIDNTKPVTTDNAPSGYQATPVTVTLSPTDAGSGVNVTEYSVDGGPYTVGTSVTIPAPADGSNDGAHTIAYFSADNVGNIEQVKSTTVLIDTTPPTCPSCTASDYLRGTVTLSASPVDNGGGIKSVTFQYSPANAGTWTTIGTDTTGPAPYTATWDTTTVPDGHYDLRIIVTDNANNATTTDLPDKVVDNTPPNVATVGAPTQGAIVAGNVNITASAADATSPIASVDFLVRGVSIGTVTTAPYVKVWDSTTVPDGTTTIQVVVTDMAGNTTASAIRTITVDNRAPSPTLDDPGANLRGTVTLNATSDPDTVQVDFQRKLSSGSTWTTISTDTTAPFSASFDTTTVPDGLYDFRVVATDGTGNTGTSPVRANVRIDNTPPAGALTAPAAGATVGGSAVPLAVTASDTGSGVASVRYEYRATGSGSFTPITTSTTSPFGGSWNTVGLTSGNYDLRPVITDGAGNSFTGATVTVTVDATAPTVVLADPGAAISGTVTLSATVNGTGATQVAFSTSPAGANAWQPISTDTTAPYAVSFNTTSVSDGLYDLRAVVTDANGNTSQDVRTGVRVDNTAPWIVSSTPADGTRVDSASSIDLVLSEVGTTNGVTLDGAATVAPVVTGTHVLFNTGALATGNHTLGGTITDASGKSAPFRIHFTVFPSGTSGNAPPIEKNTSASAATTLTSTDGFATATMPGGAWSPQGNDWLVIRIDTGAAPAGSNGFVGASELLDVTAYWALSGVQVHQFNQPIEIFVRSTGNGLVPATFEGSWRALRRTPTAGSLPATWADGFFRDSSGYHILTRHLSQFTLLRDIQPPAAPSNVLGFLDNGDLTLSWTPGADNSGTYDYVRVFSDGTGIGDYAPGTTTGDAGPWSVGDPRAFTLRETDLAGNVSAQTSLLRAVPSLVGLTPDAAQATLAAAGFQLGNVTEGGVGPVGTITGPGDLVLAEPGSSIDVTIASGSGGATKFVFGVVTRKRVKSTRRPTLAARISLTRAAQVTAELLTPRGVKLYTWRFNVKAGRTIVKLRFPRQVRRGGMYSIRWTARHGSLRITKTVRIRVVRKTGSLIALPLEVVLAGKVPSNLPLNGSRRPKVVAAASADNAFDVAAAGSDGLQVIVVNVDTFGLAFVRDLHTVFPGLKIVALTRSPKTMVAAIKAGATVALPSTTSPSTIAAVVSRLLTKR